MTWSVKTIDTASQRSPRKLSGLLLITTAVRTEPFCILFISMIYYFSWWIYCDLCLFIMIYCLCTCKWPYIVLNWPVCLYMSKDLWFFAKDTLVWLIMLCVGGVVGRAGPSLLEEVWKQEQRCFPLLHACRCHLAPCYLETVCWTAV